MDLRSELLKSIWYAFTSLDVERSGKVSKSQLKVLSHNLYTALNIPHDPVALEEHFRDDDEGPVSNQGYMPYLNSYILAKAKEGNFDKETFDGLCWMMTAKKNYRAGPRTDAHSRQDSFKLFCLFNLLSEDRYPLIMVPAEVEYLMKKISAAMGQEWEGKQLEDLLSQDPSLQEGMSVWQFLDYIESGRLLQVTHMDSFSLALDEIFQEMYHSVLKKGYMWKKGHVRRNWNERWFILKPSNMSYYASEDLKDKKGEIVLDKSCVVESLPDKEGRRCLFCVRTSTRTYEMSASDQKQRIEWMQAMQTALRLLREGKSSLHQELKLRRREQRESSRCSREELRERQEQQEQQIESIIQHQREAEAKRRQEEEREKEHQRQVQRELERQLKEAEKAKECMVEELNLRDKEAEQQRRRIHELEMTQEKLEAALNTEIQARLEEEQARLEQDKLQQEEEEKLRQLRQLQQQESLLEQTQAETDTLQGVSALHTASQELRTLRETRERSSQQLEEAQKKLEKASSYVKHWNIQLNRLMKPISPGERHVKKIYTKPEFAFGSQELVSRPQPGVIQDSQQTASQSEDEDLSRNFNDFSISNNNETLTQTNGNGF